MRIWRYQSPNPCYAKEDLELFFICPALSSKPQKPWCPWSYLEITVAEPRPLAMLLFANYGKDLRDEWHSAASFCWLLSFVDWDDLYIVKPQDLRHTNEMQWTNWLPLTRKRYKALNVTCMLCLCKCHGHSDDILSNPIDFNMTNVTWRTWTTKYTPRIFFCWIHNFLVWKPLRKSLGSVPFITFFAWKLPWSSGEAGITFPWN